MKYQIKMEKAFVKRMNNLEAIFHLSHADAVDARETIIDAIADLQQGTSLPVELSEHILKKEPWIGFHEFHVLADLLVVYYRVDNKRRIRMVTVTNHEELTTGRLPK